MCSLTTLSCSMKQGCVKSLLPAQRARPDTGMLTCREGRVDGGTQLEGLQVASYLNVLPLCMLICCRQPCPAGPSVMRQQAQAP